MNLADTEPNVDTLIASFATESQGFSVPSPCQASMIDQTEAKEDRGGIPSPVRIVSDYKVHADSDADADVDHVPASSDCTEIIDKEENTPKLEGLSPDEVGAHMVTIAAVSRRLNWQINYAEGRDIVRVENFCRSAAHVCSHR